jgi:uncharacterized lipoprotein
MIASMPSFRPLLIGVVAVVLVSQAGCTWTRNKLGMDAKYEDSVQNRPLEVPPGLDLPNTTGAIVVPEMTTGGPATGAAAPGAAPAAGGITSFTMADTVESAWRRIGLALGNIDGVSISERAQLLNSYAVTYQGTSMLIRAQQVSGETQVVALGADGLPLTSGPGAQLLALLKARLG